MKTAILFSGTAHNFKYSIQSLMDNVVVPNDADVFILTSRYNLRRKTPHTTDNLPTATDYAEWDAKALTSIRDVSQPINDADIELIRNTFGDRLKGLYFIDDMPEYQNVMLNDRIRMMDLVNKYRRENTPAPFGGDVTNSDNGNIKCVIDQFNNIKKCYEIMEAYENGNGFKYDFVMRIRLDFVAPDVINIAHYYLNQDYHYLYCMGCFRIDKFEWMDEWGWFSHRDTAAKLFPYLNRMGFTINKKYNTIGSGNEFLFAPETQFSLLLHELNMKVINVHIYRSACYTDGGDGFDYMNYRFLRYRIDMQHEYGLVCRGPSDINEHLPILKEYASKCDHVTELGTRFGNSTVAFMAASPRVFISYDVQYNPKIDFLKLIAKESDVNFIFKLENPTEIEETDLLFIDTNHNVESCSLELKLHADKVRKYLIFHDIIYFWEKGQGHEHGGGLRYAIEPFMREHPEWRQIYRAENNNGLLILERC